MKRLISGIKKGSATSVVLITFAILIYIVIPLGKAIFEQVFFQHIRENVIVFLDSAVFAASANIDTESFSEKKLSIVKEEIERYIFQKLQMIVPHKVELNLQDYDLTVELTFRIKSIFQDRESLLTVKGQYRFEELNQPDFQ